MSEYYLHHIVDESRKNNVFLDPSCTWSERNILSSLGKHIIHKVPVTLKTSQIGILLEKDMCGVTTYLVVKGEDPRVSGAIFSILEKPLRNFRATSMYASDELGSLNKTLAAIGLKTYESQAGESVELLISLLTVLGVDYDPQISENAWAFNRWLKNR